MADWDPHPGSLVAELLFFTPWAHALVDKVSTTALWQINPMSALTSHLILAK